MPEQTTPDTRHRRTVAPGINERHAGSCNLSTGKHAKGRKPACTCTPAYDVVVSVGGRDGRARHRGTLSTLGDAIAWRDDRQREARMGEQVGTPAPQRTAVPTVRVAASDFVARMESGEVLARGGKPYSPATVDNYADALTRNVIPYVVEAKGCPLGDLPADGVDTRLLETLAASIASGAKPKGEPRDSTKGNGTARLAVAALRRTLADLYARGLIERVPEAPPTMPAPPAARDRRLSMDEAGKVIAASFADDKTRSRSLLGPLVMLASRIGARRAEILGLTWGPGGVDLSGKVATVTIARSTTKTDAGARTLGLEDDMAKVLREHRMATGRPVDGTPVFPHPGCPGKPVTVDLLRYGLGRIAKVVNIKRPDRKTGKPETINLGTHLFRHSVASWAVEGGTDHVEVAARLGHSDAAFTIRTYAHADRDRIAREPLDLGWSARTQGA